MKTLHFVVLVATLMACKPATGPDGGGGLDAGPLIEAGVGLADGACAFLEGVDSDGTIRSVCAYVDEIASVIAFVTMLRLADAGAPPARCAPLPGSTFCASPAEVAQGVSLVARKRLARLTLDGGQ